MRRRFALVFNARAGVARPRLLRDVLKLLHDAGAEIFPLVTSSAEDATRQVAEIAGEGALDAVIAAGGDGTIRAVAAGLAGTSIPVGIIPLGTGNVLKYEIGLKSRARDIAQMLIAGPVIDVEGGTVNGAPFFLMVGAGFDGRIVAALDQKVKRLLGRLAYGGPVLRTLAAGPDDLDIDIDGVACRASWIIVSNAARYGGSFVLTRQTGIGAKGLVAVLVQGRSRLALLRASLALGLGRLADPRKMPGDMRAIPCQRVTVASKAPVPVEVDGDEAGTTPLEISGAGPKVHLIVPQRYVAEIKDRHTNHLH